MTRRQVALGLAAIALVVVALNVAGVLRFPGGPLREPGTEALLWLDARPANQGTNSVGLMPAAGVKPGEPIYTGISLRNQWQWPATVEQIRLVGATPGLELLEVRMALPGTSGSMVGLATDESPFTAELRLHADYGPLPAELAGHNELGEGRVWIKVTAPQPGEHSYDAVAVDYRVGPFSFSVVHHQALVVCLVPLPEGASCSLDEP